jgi:F-type H+-transporting ATPase subunit a
MVEPHQFWFAWLLNKLIGAWVTPLLVRVGMPPANPAQPIPKYVAEEVLVMLIIIVGAAILRLRLSVEKPGKFQLAMEAVVEFTQNLGEEVLGGESKRFLSLIGTIGIFISLCNLLGVIPTFDSPTSHWPVPLGCATLVFLHYNWQGVKRHGPIGYVKHLCGPMMAMAFLMLPVEVFSNIMRMLSLTVRLGANMLAGEILVQVFTRMTWVVVPAVFLGLHIFESFLQAYIFMVLPFLYVRLAVESEH